jgi:diguanylate cyclase (GGDEF)-like protein
MDSTDGVMKIKGNNKIHYIALFTFFIVIVTLFIGLMFVQRSTEIKRIEDQSLIQNSLIAQKLSAKFSLYEMTNEKLANEIKSKNLNFRELQQLFDRQMILNRDVINFYLYKDDQLSVFPNPNSDCKQQMKELLESEHFAKRLKFAVSAYKKGDEENIVVSLLTTDANDKSFIIALDANSESLFDSQILSSAYGVEQAVIFRSDKSVFASYSSSSKTSYPLDIKVLLDQIFEQEASGDNLLGTTRLYKKGNRLIVLSSIPNFPLSFSMTIKLTEVIGPFNSFIAVSSIALILLLAVTLFLIDKSFRQLRDKESLQQKMVEELSALVKERTASLEKLTMIDTLTNLTNRREINKELEQAIRLHNSLGITFSLLLIDVDDFKNINDKLGHVAGDEVLTFFSKELSSVVGKRGIVARWGGDEFMVLLPELVLKQATTVADEIQNKIAEAKYKDELAFSLSIGVAEHVVKENSLDLVKKVDRALYKAKNRGKNRVEIAQN